MSADIPSGVWAQIGTIIAVLVGIFSIIAYLDRKVEHLKKDFCKDLHDLKGQITEVKSDGKEILAKLNEHLVLSSQSLAELDHLKERLEGHDDELEDLQRRVNSHF